MADSVDKLTAAVAAGDEAAVESFYRRYFDWFYAQARRATRRDEAFCLDVVQETVLRVMRSIRRVETEPQLLAWLRLVVRTTAYDLLRAEQRRQQRETVAATVGARDSEEPGGADEEQLRWLREEVARLDPEIIRMIELRYEHRWTLQRIGSLLGLSAGTIDGRLRRALKKLRDRAPGGAAEDCDD